MLRPNYLAMLTNNIAGNDARMGDEMGGGYGGHSVRDGGPGFGGGGPMPVPDGGPHWRQGNPVGDLPTGGGGGPMPVPDGGPNWRNDPNFNDEGSAAHAWGMRGGMPIPDGGPNWRTQGPVGDQPTGGGGPMPTPPPWIRFGGKPEDYGVTMEYGGPGAINPVGMGPQDLRNLYNPPPPPPPNMNPQMSTPPSWGGSQPGLGGINTGVVPPGFGTPAEPKRHGVGGDTPPMAGQAAQLHGPGNFQNPRMNRQFQPRGFGGMNGGQLPTWQNAMGSSPQGRMDFLNKLKQSYTGGNGFKWKM